MNKTIYISKQLFDKMYHSGVLKKYITTQGLVRGASTNRKLQKDIQGLTHYDRLELVDLYTILSESKRELDVLVIPLTPDGEHVNESDYLL